MQRKLLLIFLFTLFSTIKPQSFQFSDAIGKFLSASAFTLTPGNIFYVADEGKNEIIKLDTLGNKLQSIGGYGWSSSTFDNPTDIFATDLRVFVTDKNNNRIQVFDKDLNYLFEINPSTTSDDENTFRYPTSCATSIQGDIYVLDSDNTRVMKYNSVGNFLLDFGNYSSGNFLLENPIKLALSQDSKIFVLDNGFMNVYDQYGMGLIKIKTDFQPENINITFNNLILNSEDSLYYQNLLKPIKRFINITPANMPDSSGIIEAILHNNDLYLLTKTEIWHFKKNK